MKSHQLYCGACDRPVRVLITDAPTDQGHAELTDAEIVCLEIGAKCTGNMCPLGAEGPGAMMRRIVRNGIPLDTLETVQAHCPACDADAEMVLYGDGRAACSVCGNSGRWAIDHLEPV